MTLDEIKDQMEKVEALHSRGVSYNNYKDVLDKAFRIIYASFKCHYETIQKLSDLERRLDDLAKGVK